MATNKRYEIQKKYTNGDKWGTRMSSLPSGRPLTEEAATSWIRTRKKFGDESRYRVVEIEESIKVVEEV